MSHKPSYEELEERVRELENEMRIRRRSEEALRKSEGRYRALVETSSDWLWEVDANGRYVYASSKVRDILGYEPEEIVGHTPFDLMPGEEARRVGAIFAGIASERRPFSLLENVNLHKDGRRVVLETSGIPVFSPSGEFAGYRGVDRDITERKQTEEALEEREQKFRGIFDQTFQLMGLLTVDGRLIEANKNALQFAGVPESDVIGKPFWETVWWKHSPEQQEILRVALNKAATGKFVRFETNHYSSGGNLHHMDFSLKPIMDEAGGVTFLIAEGRDINERKMVEEALRGSETRLRAITGSARDAILMMDPEGTIIYWNPAAERILGYTKEEARGQNLHGLLAPRRYHKAYRRAFPRFRETGQGEAIGKTLELVARRKDGKEIPIELSLSAVFLGGWQAVGLLRDISERKQAEAALQESQRQLADIIDFLPDATFVIDREGKVIKWNRAMEKMTGISAERMVGKGEDEHALPFYGEKRPLLIYLIDAGDEELESKYKNVWKRRGILYTETYVPNVYKGEGAHLFATAAPLFDAHGNRWGAIESIRDVTARKQAEVRLRESEEKYRKIFEDATEGIFQTTPEGRYLSVNPAFAKMFGFSSPEEMANRDMVIADQLYVNPQERESMVQRLNEHGKVKQYEVEVYRKDRSKFWISINIHTVRDADGNILYFEGTNVDITERKHAEDALVQAEEKYRDIFENSVTGIYQITMEGRFLRVNMSIAHLLGYDSPEELIDAVSNFRESYVHPECRTELLHLIEEQGSVREFEVEFFRKDKSVVWASLNVRAVRNSAGRTTYMEGTAIDITDSKLLKTYLEQAQKIEAIGTLAGGIAHDFNNILVPIIGYTELSLSQIPEDDKLSHNMRQVLLSANRAKDLVGQILTFSRKKEQELKPVQISLLIKETFKLLRSSIPSTIELQEFVDRDAMDSTIIADSTQIHQVLMNLCTNAVHAMRPKGGTLAVSLENVEIGPQATRRFPEMEPGEYLKLSVADTGHGMDEAVRQRIFDPYFTTKGPNEGTGLGLSVVYGIVKNLSGTIAVSSKPNKGTTFDVYFPRTENIQSPATEPPEPLPTGHGRILVVDDEKSIVDMTQEILETLGYEAVPTYGSPHAIETFRAGPESFDLVITDMAMPHMNGIDLAKEILAIRPQIPIILCTGFSEAVNESKMKLLGFKELLMKPVSMRDLAVAVSKLLAGDRLPACTPS